MLIRLSFDALDSFNVAKVGAVACRYPACEEQGRKLENAVFEQNYLTVIKRYFRSNHRMRPKERMLTALSGQQPDRLPVTTHHVMPYFLEKYLGGKSTQQFFDEFGLDPILWTSPHIPDRSRKEYLDPNQDGTGFLENRRINI